MVKKLLFFILALVNFAFAMTSEQVDEFIAKNSTNLELLKSTPSKVYASNPPLLYLLYAIAPEKVSGINFSFGEREKAYLKDSIVNQPVVGGFFGQGKIPNVEMLIKLDPDLILINSSSKSTQKKFEETLGNLKKPMLYLKGFELEDYIDSLEILGKVLGEQERAGALVQYAKNFMSLTKELDAYIAKNSLKKPTIYYAEGGDGLSTECAGSWHTRLIDLSGGEVVHKCANASEYGRVKINFEQVAKYDPDIILVFEREFFDKIYSDPKWQLLSAVKNKKAFYIPREPFSWFDRPPSFMRFLGLKWLISLTYPDAFKFDMLTETREFYKLFLDLELTDEQIHKILGQSAK